MSEGLPKPPGSGEDDSEVNDEENDEAMDCPLLKRPVRAEDRKTRKQRRKARELKEAVSRFTMIESLVYNAHLEVTTFWRVL